jgi:predicted kinase
MACKYIYKGITYNSKEEFIGKVINSQILGKADVILPIGTSGSGKSTFIKSLPQENLVIIEPDTMRVEFTGDINNKSKDKEIYEEAAKRAISAIKKGKQVVFDTTNLTKDKRLPFIEAIKKEIPTANIQYKLMELNPELAKQRIKVQIARGENRANVPDSTIDRHAESYKQMLEDIKNEPITPFIDKTNTKTRRILEVQSDLFQKGRDSKRLTGNLNIDMFLYEKDGKYFYEDRDITDVSQRTKEITKEEYNNLKNSKQNQFLQLLNKDSNWVTFFIKSIIQDSVKKGYEKVLFPTGNTASKVEGHTTLEEFKKQKEDRIKELEKTKTDNTLRPVPLEINLNEPQQNLSVDQEIAQLKQELERVETEGFGALKPIYNFYENTVTNILNKTYGKENVKVITDEYGNTWNELTIDNNRDLDQILFSKDIPGPTSKPIVKDLSKWSDIKDATTPYTDKGIVTTRISNTDEHFGNPFIGSKRRDKNGNIVESKVDNITVFNTINEADQAYRSWLMGTKHQDIQPERREWILKQINDGKLDGQTLLYYKPMEVTNSDGTVIKGGYHSHADTLAEIVEQLRPSNQDITRTIDSDMYRGIPIVDTTDIITQEGTPGAASFDINDNTIRIDRKLLKQKFNEKAWTNPRKLMETIHGEEVESYAESLPEDIFKTYEEFEEFVIEHEYQHTLLRREDFDAGKSVTSGTKPTFSYNNRTIETHFQLSADQEQALRELIDFRNDRGNNLYMLQGAAGTGKTSIIGYLQNYLGEDFLYSAQTHAATVQLAFATYKTGNRIFPVTVKSSMFRSKETKKVTLSRKAKEKIGFGKVIVVDETSMLAKSDYNNLLELSQQGYKIIFMGDKKQIPEITTSNQKVKNISPAFTDLPKSNLDKIHRTSNNKLKAVLQKVRDSINYKLYQTTENTPSLNFYDGEIDFNDDHRATVIADPENTMYIGYTNGVVKGKNAAVRRLLGRTGVVKVGDIVTGYLGYASKQVEKGNLANSVNFTIKGIDEVRPGKYKLTVSSAKLSQLREDGFTELPDIYYTNYMPLSDYDALETPATEDDYAQNNAEISSAMRIMHEAFLAFKREPRFYAAYLDEISVLQKFFMSRDLGHDYVYDPSQNKMLPYDKYDKTQQVLREVANRNGLINQEGKIDSHFDNLKVEKGVDYGHAITVHKSQGSSIDNVFFDASTIPQTSDIALYEGNNQISTERQSLAYVGMSRSVKKLSVYKGLAPFVKVNTSAILETDPQPEASENITSTKGEYESEINRRALIEIENRKKEKQVKKDSELKNRVVGFYDGEKIVINKDHKNFGVGVLVHEHVHPLLNDLDSIIDGFFDGDATTKKESSRAKKTKENLYNEAVKLLGAYTLAGIRGEAAYRNLPEEKFKNEVIARAVELTSNKMTKDNKSFIDALKDFISFMVKHVRSRFFKAVIQNKSVSAKDLEPIVGINQLASVYMMSGAAKLTMDRKGNLRQGTAKSTEFDKIMERLSDLNNIKNIVDNSSFENFTKFYDHKKYNSVIEHDKPNLVEKADNNTVYENITVDGANKVAELLASGITPDTMNIAAAMLHDGWNPEHITIILNNPLLKEFFARMKAKDIIDGFSLENRQLVLEDMKAKYLPDELINLDLTNENFYTEKYVDGQRVIIPKYIIDIDKMYDRKRGLHNSDPIAVEKQNKETLKHQFEALLNTLMYQETTKELVTVSNIFNINSNGGTKSFIHDQSLYETAVEVFTTNRVGIYDLGSVLNDSYMGTVLGNFIEMRDLMSSQKGLSVITDYKTVVENFVNHYKEFYNVGEFTDYKKKQIVNAFSSALPEYIKNRIFSSLPNKDNIEYIKYKLLAVIDFNGNRNPDNLGDIIDRLQADMRKDPDHILNIEKTLFNAFETKFERDYKVVQFNTGRIAPNIKDNIKTNLLDLYNNPKNLFKDRPGYTAKTLIDDLFDYSIVTGANSGPFKFFDYMPSELLLKNFAKAEREQILDFKNNFKTADDHMDFFISVLLNNPDMLPNLDKLPRGYKGRVYKRSYYNKEKKTYDFQIYTVKKVKNAQTGVEEAVPGKMLPKITDKTKIKQYTIKFDLNPESATGIKSGYNIISGGNKKALNVPSPKIYENDNKQGIEMFQKDTSQNRNVAKHSFGDTIVNHELRAIYKDIVQDTNIESVGIEFVDLIDNNEANYGRYNRKAHTIQISTKAMMTGKYSLADILVHEYTHVQMADMVDIYENIKLGRIKKESIGDEAYEQMKFLDSVYETYKQIHPNAVASQNLDEFISEVRRSQDVRNNIKAFPEKLLKRVINAITDLIRNMLGLSKNQQINGQQIHDGTLDFISRLSKNRVLIYTDGNDTYQFTGTIDGIILGGTLNRETLVDPAKALSEILSDSKFKSYTLVSDEAEGIYNPDVDRIKPMSYNLTATEFNKKMKDIKVIMDDPALNHEDLINIIHRRFNELVYFSEIYKGILKKSSDRKELSNAKKALKLVENDIDKIMVHLEKAVNAKNTKDRMDYVDSVIDAVNDVVKSETTNPIEIMTANDFLTRLTDIFDPKKTNLNVYTDDDIADIEFITEEAKQDPEIAYKYNEQVARIVALNKKLMDKTLDTIEKEVKKKDEFAIVDFNPDSENNNRELSWFEKWTMTADRTGDDFLNWWMVLNNDVEAAYKQDISTKFDEITKVQNRLIPILERYYSNLPPGKELDNYHKFGIYAVMLDEYGNVKMPYNSTYFDAMNKFKSKIKDAETIWKNAAPSERKAKYAKLKKAKDDYANFMSDSNYSKRSDIEDAINKETNPAKLRQLQRVLDKYDIYRSAHLEKFEADYDVFSEDLKEETLTIADEETGVTTDIKKSVRRQQLEFIEENYPYQDLKDLKDYVKSKLGLYYNYSTDASSIVRRSVTTDAIISTAPRKYTYVYSVPKSQFWNDMSFMDTPEIAQFYNLYVETMKEIRDNLPTRFSEELRLSDIPFISRKVLNYSLKDLITKSDVRNSLYKDYIAGLTMKEKYMLQDHSGENYNDNIVNTRFGQLNAFSKNKAVKERLITRLKEAGLPFMDEFGKVNPRRANRKNGTYSKEFLDIEQDVKNQVDTELMELKSFDLGKVVEMYYIEAMAYKHKMKEINTLNLVKDAALKTWKAHTNKAGEPKPFNDKINMLLDNDRILKGIPARKVLKENFLSLLGKKYSVLEEKRKKELEETVSILEQELIDVKNEPIQTENTLMYIENIEEEIKKRKDEINDLGAEIKAGNLIRKILSFDIARNLWVNPKSPIGNVLMGLISNRLEAADGRVFGMDSYRKMFDKIYMKSEITPFLAGTFGGLLIGVTGGLIGAGLGFAAGYGINRLMHRRIKDPDTTTVFNMMGMFDILQQQAHEQKLETINDRSSNTYKNKLLRSDAGELVRDPMMFITKSEIPHQATILGSILDSTYILDPDNANDNNGIKLLDYLTKVGSEGMKFRTDYDQLIYLKLNTSEGPVITEVPMKILLERTATTAAAMAAKTHGNYRLNTKQLAKLDDRTVLATEFKTWAAEGFAGRYEDKKANRTISVSLTSSPYQNADETYYTKGMVQTSFEKLGTPLTLGLTILQPSFNNVLWGTIGAFTAGTILGSTAAIAAPLITVGASIGTLYYLHGAGHEQSVDKGVQRAFYKALGARLFKKLITANYYKRFSEVTINGETISTDEYLNRVLSREDAANIRKLVEQTGMLAFYSLMYYALLATKIATKDDDDDDVQLEQKYINFALNTMGRTMLDIQSYTNAGDIVSKYGEFDKIAPALALGAQTWDAAASFTTYVFSGGTEGIYERREGQYEKGDPKYIKKVKKILPFTRAYDSFISSTEQEFQMFKGNTGR